MRPTCASIPISTATNSTATATAASSPRSLPLAHFLPLAGNHQLPPKPSLPLVVAVAIAGDVSVHASVPSMLLLLLLLCLCLLVLVLVLMLVLVLVLVLLVRRCREFVRLERRRQRLIWVLGSEPGGGCGG